MREVKNGETLDFTLTKDVFYFIKVGCVPNVDKMRREMFNKTHTTPCAIT